MIKKTKKRRFQSKRLPGGVKNSISAEASMIGSIGRDDRMWNEETLNAMLSEPSEMLIADMARLEGDIMILGAGGKMGPTLSAMAKRASGAAGKNRHVYAVSRFSDARAAALLRQQGVEILPADLNDEKQLDALPKAPNVVYMLGKKFGTSGNAGDTWHTNVVMPGVITKRLGPVNYVVFSTGNVYPFTDPALGGCREEESPAPVGEYAMSTWGRERVFEYAARNYGAKVLLFRLNYAIDLRYGVLLDLAEQILNGRPIRLDVPRFNCVWQRYANEAALRSLLRVSPEVERLNVTGPEVGFTRDTARKLAAELGCEAVFEGEEGKKAMLMNPSKCMAWFGKPDKSLDDLIHMQAEWLKAGGRRLGKPTHFEETEGKF